MSAGRQQVNNKSHGNVKSISAIGRSGRNKVRSRSRQLKTIGKIYDSLQEDKNPASVIQKVHLYEKQREFLSAQAEVFERRTVTLKEEIENLTEKIAQQYKHAETVFMRGRKKSDNKSELIDDMFVNDKPSSNTNKEIKPSKSKSKSTGSKNVFSIKY
jgi:hypothetical protein